MRVDSPWPFGRVVPYMVYHGTSPPWTHVCNFIKLGLNVWWNERKYCLPEVMGNLGGVQRVTGQHGAVAQKQHVTRVNFKVMNCRKFKKF